MLKPAFQIPSMKEIEKVRSTNGYNLISTFSGAGGACLGFEMAGFKTLYANEFVKEARNTYKLNHPEVFIDDRDIRKVSAEDILKIVNLKAGEIDVLEGSPPCSSFSMAGKRDKKWGQSSDYSDNENQVTDDLFFEYIRLVRGLKPKIFVAENVKGLIQGRAKGYFKEILRELKLSGYQVEVRVVNSTWLGVPQSRERIFFIGVRNDLVGKYGVRPVFPNPLKYQYALKDVIDINDDSLIDPETQTDISLGKAVGTEWEKLPVGGQSTKYFQLVRCNPEFPVGTITASGGNLGLAGITHPYYKKKFNLKELRALCSFPEDFILTGTYAQRWERLGRSVMPLVSFAIAQRLRDDILGFINA
jgi:DNA (cytosine-5)-methyltransferase 1